MIIGQEFYKRCHYTCHDVFHSHFRAKQLPPSLITKKPSHGINFAKRSNSYGAIERSSQTDQNV